MGTAAAMESTGNEALITDVYIYIFPSNLGGDEGDQQGDNPHQHVSGVGTCITVLSGSNSLTRALNRGHQGGNNAVDDVTVRAVSTISQGLTRAHGHSLIEVVLV